MIKRLQSISGSLLLDTVTKHLSEELHMQHYPEREELLTSLIDSSRDDMERIGAGLANTFVELNIKCNKGKEKYGRFQVEWHQSISLQVFIRYKQGRIEQP